ncbi:MAG TPA: ShlB/FhaC/HecB family hemolysin secretion/activation protein [Vineibacter sp.]|nr:ShlB/FhaC/HecB family hemolysin secretion/activation protein [Vineibacter sp.]
MQLKVWIAGGVGLLASVLSVASLAQTPSPGQLAPRSSAPAPQAIPSGVIFPETQPAAAPPGSERVELTVGRIEVEGGYLQLDSDTAAAVAGVAGQRIPVTKVYEIAAAIERYYTRQGYFLTRVVIPPQQVRDGGTLRLRVVEGFIESVDAAQLPSAIRRRIETLLSGVVGDRRLTIGALERKLLLAGDTPGTALRSTITPGGETGGVKLVLAGEHRPVSAELGFDNGYARAFGRTALSASAAVNSVFGFGEQVYANVSGSPSEGGIGSDSARRLGSIGIMVPLGNDGLTFNVEGTVSTTKPRLPPGSLKTESDYARVSFRLAYPLIRSRNENLTPRLSFEVINEEQQAPQFIAVLYQDRIRPVRLGATWSRTLDTETSVWLGGDLSQGLRIFGSRGRRDATVDKPISRALADDDFTKAEVVARMLQRLPASFSFDATFYGQYSFSGPLVNAEQFTLGGPRRLSGYDLATFAGDHGWVARAELQYSDSFERAPVRGLVVPYVFAARVKVYIEKPGIGERASTGATSLGFGLRTTLAGTQPVGRDLDFQVEAARQYTDRGAQRDRWRFNLSGTVRF